MRLGRFFAKPDCRDYDSRSMGPLHVVFETPELAVEGRRLDGSVVAYVAGASEPDQWLRLVLDHLHETTVLGVSLLGRPPLASLVELAEAADRGDTRVAVSVLQSDAQTRAQLGAGNDLNLVVVHDLAPLLAAMRLLQLGVSRPDQCSLRLLSAADKLRLEGAVHAGGKRSGYLHTLDDGELAYSASKASEPTRLGPPRAVAAAIRAIAGAGERPTRVVSTVDDVDERKVLDVLFGPRRALSDPASKAALRPYGLPLPTEEVCTSASRAAAEAARINFPVRIVLASPDVRVWDHPELAVEMVESAAQVREVFRELVSLSRAATAGPPPRVLGVTVMSTSETLAAFRVMARPLPHGRVEAELSFTDPHGLASGDATVLVLPAEDSQIARAIGRLAGSAMVLGGPPEQRKQHVEALSDVLLRLAAFVNDRREEVESVELRPVCLLLDGHAEVREACVHVSDAFERTLTAALPAAP